MLTKFRDLLKHSYVCPQTGKEIDAAYNVEGNKKIAIHLDGTRAHYYLDRQKENRKTQVRNRALENAGWTNICQLVNPNDNNFMVKEQRALLQKLEKHLPFTRSLPRLLFADKKNSGAVIFLYVR